MTTLRVQQDSSTGSFGMPNRARTKLELES
jgi:hypothetical protein